MAGSPGPDDSQFLRKRNRKLSWVGVDEDTPYAYLRESMVSSLMGGICDPEVVSVESNPKNLQIAPDRERVVAEAVGTWSFSAHRFTDDELLYGCRCILEHALQMKENEQWRISTDELTSFLLASRAAYNDFVLYHNFRHVSDVLQAIFFFLVSIGTLPPYPLGTPPPERQPSAIADLLKPFEALTLLISAIGHDVGHPGVNNAFLVALNAPLAQLYNDRSVLESFHCAAYSQILRRYWPQTFSDTKMRKLMIDTILATDMGVHFKYMSDLGNLQEKLAHNDRTTDGWNEKILMEYRDLTCGLLIKCADISNVARKFEVAAQWANILTDEFSNQGRMENRLNIPTCLFGGPPVRDDYIKLGQSQIGFMNVFARPLFEAVTDILPAMQFSVDELAANKSRWDSEIAKEKERQLAVAMSNPKAPGLLHLKGLRGGFDNLVSPSPKSGSTEFLIPPMGAPTSAAPTSGAPETKSMSDPNPLASVEEQADMRRKLFNPNNIEFGTTAPAGTSTADHAAPPSREAAQSPPAKSRQQQQHKSPSGSQAASEKGVTMAPDENAASVTDQKAWQRSDSLAAVGINGATISPGSQAHGMTVGKKSHSMPAAEFAGIEESLEPTKSRDQHSTINAAGVDGSRDQQQQQQRKKEKDGKSSFGKFWKKRWRAVSGVNSQQHENREAMKSKERLNTAGGKGNEAS